MKVSYTVTLYDFSWRWLNILKVSKVAMSLHLLKKNVRDELDFLHAD